MRVIDGEADVTLYIKKCNIRPRTRRKKQQSEQCPLLTNIDGAWVQTSSNLMERLVSKSVTFAHDTSVLQPDLSALKSQL